MPLEQRIISPVHVCRGAIPTDERGQPLAQVANDLECVTNGSLANVIRQLSSLSKHADDLFGALFQEASGLVRRTNQLQVVCRESMPAAMKEMYAACDPPPPLGNLNCYRDDGKDGLKFYTDPTYFFELWRQEMLRDTQKIKQDRVGRKLNTSQDRDGRKKDSKKQVRQPSSTQEKMRAKAAQNEIHLHQGAPVSGGTLGSTGTGIGHMGHHTHEAPQFPTNLPPPVEIYGTPVINPSGGGGQTTPLPPPAPMTQTQSAGASMHQEHHQYFSSPPPVQQQQQHQNSPTVPHGASISTPQPNEFPLSQQTQLHQQQHLISSTQPPPPRSPLTSSPLHHPTPAHNPQQQQQQPMTTPSGVPPPPPPSIVAVPGGYSSSRPTIAPPAPPSSGVSVLPSTPTRRPSLPPPPPPEAEDLPPPPPPTPPPMPMPPPPPPLPGATGLSPILLLANGTTTADIDADSVKASTPPTTNGPLNGTLPPLPILNLTQSLNEVRLKPVPPKEKASPATDARSDLLAAIREGIKLRRVEDNKAKETEKNVQPRDVASILARRVALEYSDSESESDEGDSEWDNAETDC
ncbi:wiskott-Aldrich syndrome protein family member 3-like [Tropilaelaps mercedesae]|uniref:Wiskott-Aldrich syndrome protein family member n=1 Tax=Tropilaelaps mercedesae TaxID=418985 RepID=A0A1V9XTK6_9ACAR|nr:wiskott-Aldrich syndrome protein family member 3-like [Tropilaelaps mercedesae]